MGSAVVSESQHPPEITVITPMYNEAGSIQANIRRILAAMESLGVPWEYILVDDGSTDTGLEEARAQIGDNPCCRIIHYASNRGRGYALRQGFSVARGKYIVTTESDLSWGPEIVPSLYARLVRDDCDIVVASVHLPGGGLENVPPARRWLSSYGNIFMRWCYGGNLTMLSGMTRGYRREAIQTLHLESNHKEIHIEILAKAKALGMRIVEIPATIRWQISGPGRRRGNFAGMARFILPHLADSYSFGAPRILMWGTTILVVIGLGLITFGAINKLLLLTPAPMPNLITYGLVLTLMAGLCALFAGLSLQIGKLSRSVIHIQAQLEQISRKHEGPEAEQVVRSARAEPPARPIPATAESPDESLALSHERES